MSGLCQLAHYFGANVKGSDIGSNPEIDKLEKMGIIVHHSHNAENIDKDIDLVVYTSAISGDNPEYLQALKLNIPTMERAQFLGNVSQMYDTVIAVSGTHGKTTTSAMIGEVCVSAGINPTIHLGGESVGLKGNTIIGDNKYLIIEACEYKESFRYLKPQISVITNIELDHLDYYKDYSSIFTAFQSFANNSDSIIMPNNCNILHNSAITIMGDWEVRNVEFVSNGYNFNVFKKNVFYETFRLNMLGYHNVLNSLFAIAVADKIGISKDIVSKAIAGFKGVERRYETIHVFDNNCRVIIDYAHHYTEIDNSIKGIKEIYKNILVVFQPHTYSRTLKLFDEFVEVLSNIDNVVLFKTYPAREELISGGTAEDLFYVIGSKHKVYLEDVSQLIKLFEEEKCKYDCILVLGAGDLADILKRNYLTYINYC